MPKIKMSKKQVASLAELVAVPSGVKAPKELQKLHTKLASVVLKSSAANDKGKKGNKVPNDPLAERKMKFIGRKQMKKLLDDLIRKEEIDHVTRGEFLEAIAKRAAFKAESYKSLDALRDHQSPKTTTPVKPVAKQA